MLNKIAEILVRKRLVIIVIMLLGAFGSLFLIQQVRINEDMTVYLPDDSPMRTGTDIMEGAFPEEDELQSIRVMVDDADQTQITWAIEQIENLYGVESVDYEEGSNTYNKANHTLLVVNTELEYGTEAEQALEQDILDALSGQITEVHNDDTSNPDIPLWIVGIAIAILMAILFAMSGSWVEPFLFIFVIGIAIVVNLGTNMVLGTISDITFSIAAILQLVLSMDYSIILMNRYRQERALTDNKQLAMQNAIRHSFTSIASSSLTTVVGLLMLVFMSLK